MNLRSGEVLRKASKPLLALSLLLTACSETEHIDLNKPARVASLWYDDEDVSYVQICAGYDKDGYCTSYITLPIVDEESWNVTLRQCGVAAEERTGGESCVAESFQITPEEFGALALYDVAEFVGDELVRLPQ